MNRNLGKYQLPNIWDQILQDTPALQLKYPTPFPPPLLDTIMQLLTTVEGTVIFLVGIAWGATITPLSFFTPPCTPFIHNTPYCPVLLVPSLVSTLIYLFNVAFPLRPGEVATVWWLWKFVSKYLAIALFQQMSYHIEANEHLWHYQEQIVSDLWQKPDEPIHSTDIHIIQLCNNFQFSNTDTKENIQDNHLTTHSQIPQSKVTPNVKWSLQPQHLHHWYIKAS